MVRQKILKFLVGAESWVSNVSHSNAKLWDDDEIRLFRLANESRRRCFAALEMDLDGPRFLEELMKIIELGSTYLAKEPSGPVEPMKHALHNVRHLLSLVGFSSKTTEIGLGVPSREGPHQGDIGKVDLIDKMVSFRSSIRKVALESASGTPTLERGDKMLQLCDEIRDSMLQHGIELLDSKDTQSDGWQFCLPRSRSAEARQNSVKEKTAQPIDPFSIPLENLFRIGKYKGMFVEFTSEGVPIRNADGTEVSKRLLKKLLKKRELHKKRLEVSHEQED